MVKKNIFKILNQEQKLLLSLNLNLNLTLDLSTIAGRLWEKQLLSIRYPWYLCRISETFQPSFNDRHPRR